MHESSMDKMLTFKKKYLEGRKNEALCILDLGSMDINGSYRDHFDITPWKYHGLDMAPGKNVDIVLKNPYSWDEIKSNSIDIIISGQAFEHIEYFWITMLEIARILKPEGMCCLIAPSGGFEHRYPVDCWRFYPDGFASMARFARFDVLELFTQWKADERYTDGSNVWQDTMLVGKKTHLSKIKEWKERIRRSLLHRILIWST